MVAARFAWAAAFAALVVTAGSAGAQRPGSACAGSTLAAPVAACVDGAPLYAFTVDTLWRQERSRASELSQRAMLDTLLTQRLLGTYARAHYGEQLAAGQAVAFAPEVALDERLVATLREIYGKEIDAAVAGLPGGSLASLISGQAALPPQAMEQVFGKAGTLRLEIALTPAQRALAARLEVLRYRLPGMAPATVTLLDVYDRQNVQGRLAMSQQPATVALQQARQLVASRYVLHWASQRFGAAPVQDVRQALADAETVAALERLHGIGADTDSGSSLLNRLAAETSAVEVAAYYQQHKAEFTRLEAVRARHIRLSDEASARQAAQALLRGASFAATARRLSRAPDAARGGDLGWLDSAAANQDWLAGFAMSQPPGKPSEAIRAPVGPHDPAYWEIVLVEEQRQGYHPPQSETVRYLAGRAIARDRALKRLQALRQDLLRQARIDIEGPA